MQKTFPSILLTMFLFNIIFSNDFYTVTDYKKDTVIKKIDIHDIKAGTLVKKIKGTNKYEILPRFENKINISINGMVADTQMEQLFINDSSEPIEATYVFPLNHNAAVNDMYFIVNNRIIESKVKEKRKSEKYKSLEDAKNDFIRAEKRKILNMYSLSHYDKLRRSITINYR